MKRIIAPSFLAADFLNLGKEVEMVNNSAGEWLHMDIMDGHFVPNLSFGIPILEHIRKATKKICDVHLMITAPEKYIEAFAKAGADNLTIHIEASPNLHRSIQHIHSLNMKAGVALNPHTPIDFLQDIIEDIDIVLLMSVNPGFGGQTFIEHTLIKIKQLSQLIHDKGLHTLIEIDGGISLHNAKAVFDAGANVLVAGTSVFKAKNPQQAIIDLLNA